MTTLHEWRVGPSDPALDRAIARLCQAEDVVQVAVLPDAHVADDVCVGTVTATSYRLLPAAVGNDIGCGVASIALGARAAALRDARVAARILDAFARTVPSLMHAAAAAPSYTADLEAPLSSPQLERLKQREGRLEFATLGRGNHFLELQSDTEGMLWLAIHTGSRCMGPAIRRHHETSAARDRVGLAWLDAGEEPGHAYLSDASWAARYSELSRQRIMKRACEALSDVLAIAPDFGSIIHTDHNHVRRESHGERTLWVHRKGAQRVESNMLGIVPGSMGSPSYHVAGRLVGEALCSAAHGAGRALPRGQARRRIRTRQLDQQMRGVWFDARLREALREEAPAAYKDIGEVMRAQHSLVRIVRQLTPLLVYKAV